MGATGLVPMTLFVYFVDEVKLRTGEVCRNKCRCSGSYPPSDYESNQIKTSRRTTSDMEESQPDFEHTFKVR